MRSLVPPASARRVVRLVLGLAAMVSVLSVVGVAPVRAHDSAGGTPDVTITIRSGLSDRDVRVSVGDIVRFVNRDDDRHRMRSRSGQEFDTGNLEPGDSYQVRLSVAGTYAYLDERNEDAAAYRGRIVVRRLGLGGARPRRQATRRMVRRAVVRPPALPSRSATISTTRQPCGSRSAARSRSGTPAATSIPRRRPRSTPA